MAQYKTLVWQLMERRRQEQRMHKAKLYGIWGEKLKLLYSIFLFPIPDHHLSHVSWKIQAKMW